MKAKWNLAVKSGFALALVGLAALWVGAESTYPTFRGDSARTGLQVGDVQNDTPGRLRLRWWDPVRAIQADLDNWETSSGVAFNPADWLAPTGEVRAFNATLKNPIVGRAEYNYSYTTPAQNSENPNVPATGTANTFEWRFSSAIGKDYQLFVNIPVGPTEVLDAGAPLGPGLYYPQRYFVYEIVGVENEANPGNPVVDVVDTDAGGGETRLGNGGLATDRTFRATGAQITIRLLNTVPRTGTGELTDTRPAIVVYADSARSVRALDTVGETVAAPVLGRITAGGQFPLRTLGTRNDPTSLQVGSSVENYALGIVSSYNHSGLKVDATEPNPGGVTRRNIVWSWPATRQLADTTSESDRYVAEKRDWILGADIGGLSRATQSVSMDNRSHGVQLGAGFGPDNAVAGFLGIDYASVPAIAASPTARAFYRPSLPAGEYSIDMWVPGANSALARAAQVEIYRGGFLIGSATVDQTTSARWARLSISGVSVFESDEAATLSVAVTNQTTNAADVGRTVLADGIRFVRTADLSIRSTPLFTRIPVQTSSGLATRDVAIVAMENGRIYCLDADGLKSGPNYTGKTEVYWVWPSEKPASSDPNKVVGIDGPDGIAQMPTGFDVTSAAVAEVQTGPLATDTEFLLYIGSKNGKVYCLDTQGRGDGTTTRRWSWPDDYPAAPSALNVGPITGSVTVSTTSSGGGPATATVFVPTRLGRLYALDAAGSTATRTTTITWQYPAAAAPLGVGSITMSPAVAFGKIFFGAGDSKLYALDQNDPEADGDGNLVWSTDGTGTINLFGGFESSSPVVVPDAIVDGPGGMPDTLYIANPNRSLYAFDANTGGVLWSTSELNASPSGSLGFTYMNTLQNSGAQDYPTGAPPSPQGRPVVMVPMLTGQIKGYFARTGDTNRLSSGPAATGLRDAGGYKLEGTRATSPAFGGKPLGWTPLSAAFDEEYGFMYVADALGTMYAFGDDPDFADGDLALTPGDSPVAEEIPPNDPTIDILNGITLNSRSTLLLPDDYQKLWQKFANGTPVAYAEIQALANTSGAIKSKVTRTAFEYGETLYVMVYNLPENPTGTTTYQVQAEVTATNSATRRQFGPTYAVTGTTPDLGTVSLIAIPLRGTGTSGLAPGSMTMRVSAVATRPNRGSANATLLNANYAPSLTYTLANPLAISRLSGGAAGGTSDSIGVTLNPASPEVLQNGSFVSNNLRIIRQGFGDSVFNVLNYPINFVKHGTTAESVMFVLDRSAMSLLNGFGKGLTNVRFRGGDMVWKLTDANDNPVATDFRIKTLDPSYFAGYEDAPNAEDSNTSLDYPNIRRDALTVAAKPNGLAQNPVFQPVELEGAIFGDVERETYETDVATYNAGLTRVLRPTEFQLQLDVPKYQPPTAQWYESRNRVYIDPGGTSISQFTKDSAFAYREYRGAAYVAVDERLSTTSPTVDLGPIPQGGIYLPGQDPRSNPFLMNDATFGSAGSYTRTFTVWNEGNVNLLNVRVGKDIQNDSRARVLGSPSLNFNAWMDTVRHLHSDLDESLTPVAYNRKRIVQKSRVGDGVPTRLRLAPPRRGNVNLGVADSGFPPIDDPKLTVSVPIGTPVGKYRQDIYAFEDTIFTAGGIPTIGVLSGAGSNAIYESYIDPGIRLSFEVVEARITNRNTRKSGSMVDALTIANDHRFMWANQEPAGYRDSFGNLVVVFSSNRQSTGGGPGWTQRLRTQSDSAAQATWSLYAASLRGDAPSGAIAPNPTNDLDQWGSASNQRWFIQNQTPFPGGSYEALFGVGPNTTINPSTVRFGMPAFPAMGAYNPLQNFPGRGLNNSVYLTFVGEASATTANGETVRLSQLFIATVTTNANGQVTINNVTPLAVGGSTALEGARIGRPSIVQTGSTATVFFTTTSGGLQQLNWAVYTNGGWVRLGNSVLGSHAINSSFETVGSVSAILRNALGAVPGPQIQLSFTGKLRGKSNSEVYLATMNCNNAGVPQRFAGSFLQVWATRTDDLIYDRITGAYWSRGVELRSDATDTNGTVEGVIANPLNSEFIDVLRRVNGGYESILDNNTRQYDASSRLLIVDTIFGGQAQIDLSNGSVKLAGALVPTKSTLILRSTPRFARISESEAQNYSGVNMVFDDRYQTELPYAASESFTFGGGSLFDPAANQMRVDRYILSYSRTATQGGANTGVRPYLRTLRHGFRLPSLPALNSSGLLVRFSVSGMASGSFYQVDPVRGNIYVTSENESRVLTVRYTIIDSNGNQQRVQTTQRVGYVGEMDETPIPVSEPGTESPMTLMLDPFSGAFSAPGLGRPGLWWMLWSSTRDGSPDVFMQTWAPVINSQPGN